ncbi:MAG: HemX protein negative effector of steady-state concentration of glutamyl-tRNA reductase [Myxococcaceae bacterium]|nr:HemX protein negative effector of steady-state concentration of glutamyl-tRNA reductase [Myxococcaceae bacterium]
MNDTTLYLSFVIASVAYLAASVGYFTMMGSGNKTAELWSGRVLLIGAIFHVVFLIGDTARHPQFGDVRQMLTIASLAIVSGHLIALRYGRLAVLGAFITPIVLLMFLAAGLGHSVPDVPDEVRTYLLPAHVLVNVLGVAAFTMAFAVATAYLIQERLLRRRQLGGLFTRLPPLDVLDSLGLKLLLIGFPLFTLGSISGAFWAAKLPVSLSPAQVIGLIAWGVFATVLLLRVAAGWQGRRAAIGTLLGFACALAVLIGYALRTTHAGAM